ncbi:Flotillin-like protein 2 [Coccomyxa sp. Obi]|nr:Flotillin-like protein 2 [Coccomyxa sp. Obi]
MSHHSIAHVNANSREKIGKNFHNSGLKTAESWVVLVKTGVGVTGMRVGRTFFLRPGQKVISKDMVPFDIPVTFTIQPHDPETDLEGFKRYASRMNGLNEGEFYTILTGVIHGQTRILAGTLTVLEIFNNRDNFKIHVQEKVEKELIPYGMSVTNANISELRDMPGEDNKIEVAANRKKGDVGTKELEGEAIQETARITAENVKEQVLDMQQKQEVREQEASIAPKARTAQLQTDLNKMAAEQHLEYLRSTQFTEATVQADIARVKAEGQAQARRALADAELYAQEKQADAVKAKLRAQAEGLKDFMTAADPDLIKFYLALEHNLFPTIAGEMAKTVHGLNPKINIWTTSGGAEGAADAMAPLKNLFTSLPPMLDAVQSQTGMKLPSWMPQQSNGPSTSS